MLHQQQYNYPPQPGQAGYYDGQPQMGVPTYQTTSNIDPKADQRFDRATPAYNDVWAAVLWIISLGAVVVVGFYKLGKSEKELPSDMDYGKITGYTILSVVIGLCLSVPLHYFMKNHAEKLIYAANVTYIGLMACFTIYLFALGTVFAGVITLLFALLYAVWFAMVRDRIPFAAKCLSTSAEIVDQYKATMVNAAAWLMTTMLFIVLWSFGVYSKDGLDAGNFVMWLWLLLFYWSVQVFANIIHVTTCGVVAMYYFTGGGQAMPANPTMGAMRRATSYSLGSICFGSLIVAALKTFRAMVRQAMRGENEFVRCIVMCVVDCIERLMEYFNEYAYVQVAVYGKSYIQAAKDTWNLVKTSGVLALINDQLLQVVFIMFALGGGLLTGAVLLIASGTWVYFVLGLFIGMTVVSMLAGLVQSGVQTLFVCFAEDPMALQRSNPMLYDAFNTTMAGYTSDA
eukprot:PhM_4_TR18809/c2_g1_i1/m.32266